MSETATSNVFETVLASTNLEACINQDEKIVRLLISDKDEDVTRKVFACYDACKTFNADNDESVTVMVDLKNCSLETKANVIKAALHNDELEDPLMLLNIFNLVKVYNTLDDSYFQSEDIFVNSVEELLDLKLTLSEDIKDFSRRLSTYFLSIIKSYNKMTFTPADEHVALPKTFESLILASDLLSLSGIFAKSANISTDELVYVDNAYIYMTSLINKGIDCANMLSEFLEDQEVQ